ncbi:tyrosine-protein phosphatase [Levilactobacillus yonginensis]|uniref:tyrosine-protein phosphatase n=1 Tax=Levilactobacillus yonginensis TaxID=1054041 RepID=UPI00345D53C7
MQRSSIVKSLSIAGVVLSLAGIGGPSALAATTQQAPVAITRSTRNADDDAALKALVDQYGDINKTLIPLVGAYNARDLGGYQTADGKWQIRPKRLIRSSNLNGLTNGDKKVLSHDYHVTSIVDFRTPGQIDYEPDQPVPGATSTELSILGPHAFGDSSKHPTLSGDFSGDGSFYVQRLEFGYPAVNGYHEFLNKLLTNSQATLYHCSSGKDRTGIATVLVMSILGMSEKTITDDYMQSNEVGGHVEAAWIKEYFSEIKSNYGSMTNYITTLINFTPAQQAKLRSMYLISTDGKKTAYPAPKAPAQVTHPTVVTPATPAKPAPAKPATTPATKPAVVTHQSGAADKPVKKHKVTKAKKKAKIKITSTKNLHTKYTYRLKGNKKWFKDSHLKKAFGHTPKHKKTTWKLVKEEHIKINGKKHTYFEVKDHAGHKAWIDKSYITKVK